MTRKTRILLALIPVIGGIVVAFIEFGLPMLKNPPVDPVRVEVITGIVVDSDTGRKIPNITVGILGRTESDESKDDGYFRIYIRKNFPNEVTINVDQKGYKVYKRAFDFPREGITVKLEKL